MSGAFLLYGATGYTGTLIAEECARRRLPVVLGGRSEGPLRALAEQLHLPFVTSRIDESSALDAALLSEGVTCVLHCAGPFSRTSRPMVDACLRTGRHYLDITGEIGVFEALAARDAEAKAKGVMLLPGVGFDVVPSDCMAAHVKQRLPEAVKLRLCIAATGSLSHGTATTMVEHLEHGGAVRKGGKIVSEPAAARTRTFDLGDKGREAVSMPWGDIATAWHSTGIPDIEVYFSLPPSTRTGMRLMKYAAPLLRSRTVKRLVQSLIPQGGPDAEARARGKSIIVAEAEDAAGRVVSSRLHGPEGYALTAQAAILCALKVLEGKAPVGFQTPASAYGADLILAVPGTARVDVA